MSALSAALLIFNFQFNLLFSHISVTKQHQHCGVLRNIGHRTSDGAENMRKYVSCTERIDQGKDFELILTVKMETRHPVEGQFGSEFLAICNHCGVITA